LSTFAKVITKIKGHHFHRPKHTLALSYHELLKLKSIRHNGGCIEQIMRHFDVIFRYKSTIFFLAHFRTSLVC